LAATGVLGAVLWVRRDRRRRFRPLRRVAVLFEHEPRSSPTTHTLTAVGAAATPQAEDPARAALASLSAPVALAGEDGVIRWKNGAWDRAAERTGALLLKGVVEGTDYVQLCRDVEQAARDGHEALAQGLQAVLRGERSEFSYEYDCGSPTQEGWHELLVETLQRPARGVLLLHRDITPRKRREMDA